MQPKSLDSLWYERIGESARKVSEYDLAILKFKKATELENPTLSLFKSLAETYYDNDELLSACSSMEKALDMVIAAESPDKDEMTSIYVRLASWYSQLQQPERAVTHYQQALEVDPTNQDALSGMLITLISSGFEDKIQDLILKMSKLASKDADLSQLASTLLSQLGDYSYDAPLRGLVFICGLRQDCMDALLEAMDQVIEVAKKRNLDFEILVLFFYRDLAALHNDWRNDQALSRTVSFWTDCYTGTVQALQKNNNDDDEAYLKWRYVFLYKTIIGHLSFYYFEQARKLDNYHEPLTKLQALSQGFRFPGVDGMTAADTSLAQYHTLHGDRAAARDQMRQYMRISIDDLSDSTDENDYWAAYTQFKCLAASGDDLNALTAWSLLEPIEKDVIVKTLNLEGGPEKGLVDEMIELVKTKCPFGASQVEKVKAVQTELEARLAAASQETDESNGTGASEEIRKALKLLESVTSPKTNETNGDSEQATISPLESKDIANSFGYTCDGTCGGKPWGFDNALNVCKYCWDVGFCDDCVSLLKDGKLKKIVCSPTHDWLAVPKCNPRGNMAARDGTVQIGGELVDGIRVGGETVTVKEWLDSLKKEWEI